MILTLSVVGLGVMVIAVKRVFFKHRPEQYIQLAQKAESEGKYEEAALNYEFAFRFSEPKDAELLVKEGEMFSYLVLSDPESVNKDVRTYRRALEVDPKCKIALQKMVQAYSDQIDFFPQQQSLYPQLKTFAQRLVEVDPSDKKTKAKIHTSVVAAWLNGVVTDTKVIEEEISEMGKLMEEDPTNVDLPYIMSLAKLQQAQEAQRSGRLNDRERLRNEAAGIIEAGIKAQPNNPEMHVKAAMTYVAMARAGRAFSDPSNKEWTDRFRKELQRSRELVDEKNTKYVELQAQAAILLMQLGQPADREAAQALLEQLLKEHPNEPTIRLNYAKLMRNTYEGRNKALEWLDKPIDHASISRVRAPVLSDYEEQMLIDATGLRMEQYVTEKDEAKKADWMKRIEQDVDRVSREVGEQPPSLTLRGRLLQLQGKNMESIQMLEKARTLMTQQRRPRDFELLFALARGYYQQGETGQARSLLLELVSSLDSFVPARIMLVQMFLQENQLEDPHSPTNPNTANGQLGVLETLAPDDPDVIRMRLVYYILKDMPEQAKGMLVRMPEGTAPQCLTKASLALRLQDNAEALRQLEMAVKFAPTNVDAVSSLAGMRLNAGQRELAIRGVKDALDKDPTSPALKAIYLRVTMPSSTNPTKEDLDKVKDEIVKNMKDPVDREIYAYNMARSEGKTEEALKHLAEAEKLKPNDVGILTVRFQNAMMNKNWDEAQKYADKLGAQNADKAGGAVYRFRATLSKGDLANALSQAQDLTKRLPEFSVSWLCMGQALEAMGQYESAVDRGYLQALGKRTESVMALKGIINCYYQMGQPDKAFQYIQQAKTLLPDNHEFVDMLIAHSLMYGDGKIAAAARLEAINQSPDDPENYENAAVAYLRVIRVALEQNPTDAGRFVRNLHELMDKAIVKWPDDSRFYAHKADAAMIMNNFELGETALKKLQARPAWKDKFQPYRMLGDYYSQFAKADLAEQFLTQALQMAPKENAIRQRLAKVQAQSGKVDAALKTLEPIASEPNVYRQQVQILMASGRSAEAEKLVLGLQEKNPNSPELMRVLLSIYTDSQRYDRALEIVHLMLKADPNDTSALLSQGLIEMQGPDPKLDLAIADFKRVKEKSPTNVDARYWLAMAYRQQKKWDDAIHEMDAALQQAPYNRSLRLKLIELCSTASPPQWAEVERLIKDAQKLQQFKTDPTWLVQEADMRLQDAPQHRARPDLAWNAIQVANQMAPDDLNIKQKYLNVMLANRMFKETIDETDALLKKPVDTWWVRLARGTARYRMEQKDEALVEYEKAVSNPVAQQNDAITTQIVQSMTKEMGVKEALAQLGTKAQSEVKWKLLAAYLYQISGDTSNSLQIIEKIMEDESKLPPAQLDAALRLAGSLYLSLKPEPNYAKAELMFKRILERNPNDIGANNNMACLKIDLLSPPSPHEALQYAQRAYDAARQANVLQPMIIDTYGWALVNSDKADQVETGLTVLRQVVEHTPFLDAHYHLGVTYLKRDMPEEAANQFQLAAGLVENMKRANTPYDANLEKKINVEWQKARVKMEAKQQVRAP